MPQPLAGIRVVDFSHVMAGPFATYFLRLLGAEVIKIEPPGAGDLFRNYDADRRYAGMSPAFIAANAGKKSVVLDLKSALGVEAARRLIARADIVVENFRPGVIDKLGFGYDACKNLTPNIIFCSVSGYGQEGPLRDYPAIDNVVQAAAGVMSVSGDPDGPPMRMGVPIVDTYAGTLAAIAVLSAVIQRDRFGGPQKIDVSLFDASLVMLTSAITPFLVKGEIPRRTGNVGYSAQPTAGMFICGDGKAISLGVVQQNQWLALCTVLGRRELIDDPRFVDVHARRQHFDALTEILNATFAAKPAEAWEHALSMVGCPCGVVRNVGEACSLAQADLRGIKLPVTIPGLPDGEDVHVLNAGFLFEHDGPGLSDPPPRHGEHTQEVLAELGLGDAVGGTPA
jgi:crotonobetainyl-CoA:carnitine CoA-transferase CaiB-like acyl-CoA transferase